MDSVMLVAVEFKKLL